MAETNLDKYLHTVRRIEEHREEDAVKEIKKLYRRLIKDLRAEMADIYASYADPETGALQYAQLHRRGLDARLLEEIASNMNDVTLAERREIMNLVQATYDAQYTAMVDAVNRASGNDMELQAAFSDVNAAKAEALRAAVDNPVHGLTLSEQLEMNRAAIIYGIKQAVGVGMANGDRYDTMARRIQETLIGPDGAGGSYYKSVRIARTEAHRVREAGNLDAALNLTGRLQSAGYSMVKTWRTMKDERVRPSRSYRTKSGWKYKRSGKYDHQKMEGVSVPINEKFKLPSGAEAMAPGQSGVAGEDINCRCFLSYSVVRTESVITQPEVEGVIGDLINKVNTNKILSRKLVGVEKGNPMTFEEADNYRVNPNAGIDWSYDSNCQSCVVVFEARQRGYNVQAKGLNPNSSIIEKLRLNPNRAWLDPVTRKHPEYITSKSIMSVTDAYDFIGLTVEKGKRYTIQFPWKKNARKGHIINLDRDETGALRFKDNQRAKGEKDEWAGELEITDYLKDTVVSDIKILRIDNMDFSDSVARRIMEAANDTR